ncbi:hypothetical protein HMPREF1604_00216 [Escherichia coli 908519]|nr:hypothetical protein HMPREF1604_00216 [Escherichia coli 908519]
MNKLRSFAFIEQHSYECAPQRWLSLKSICMNGGYIILVGEKHSHQWGKSDFWNVILTVSFVKYLAG